MQATSDQIRSDAANFPSAANRRASVNGGPSPSSAPSGEDKSTNTDFRYSIFFPVEQATSDQTQIRNDAAIDPSSRGTQTIYSTIERASANGGPSPSAAHPSGEDRAQNVSLFLNLVELQNIYSTKCVYF